MKKEYDNYYATKINNIERIQLKLKFKNYRNLINLFWNIQLVGRGPFLPPLPPPVLYTKSRVGCEVSTLSICI